MKFARSTVLRIVGWSSAVGFSLSVLFAVAQPRLEITPGKCDLGLMTPGTEASGEVTLRNTGWRSLTIQECRASCGCSRLELSREQIPPGQTAVIRAMVHANVTHRGGEISMIHLKTNCGRQPDYRIPITTLGAAGLRLIPDSVDLGAVSSDSPSLPVRARLVVNPRPPGPHAEAFECRIDDPHLTARLVDSPQDETEVEVQLIEGTPPGDYWSHLTVTEINGRRSAVFPVHATVLGPHHSKPGIVLLNAGNVTDRSAGKRVLVTRRHDGTADGLTITDVVVPPILQEFLTTQIEASDALRIKVTSVNLRGSNRSRVQQSICIHVRDPQLGDSSITMPVAITLTPHSQSGRAAE